CLSGRSLSACVHVHILMLRRVSYLDFFSLHNAAITDLFTLSLHDALPICRLPRRRGPRRGLARRRLEDRADADRPGYEECRAPVGRLPAGLGENPEPPTGCGGAGG